MAGWSAAYLAAKHQRAAPRRTWIGLELRGLRALDWTPMKFRRTSTHAPLPRGYETRVAHAVYARWLAIYTRGLASRHASRARTNATRNTLKTRVSTRVGDHDTRVDLEQRGDGTRSFCHAGAARISTFSPRWVGGPRWQPPLLAHLSWKETPHSCESFSEVTDAMCRLVLASSDARWGRRASRSCCAPQRLRLRGLSADLWRRGRSEGPGLSGGCNDDIHGP